MTPTTPTLRLTYLVMAMLIILNGILCIHLVMDSRNTASEAKEISDLQDAFQETQQQIQDTLAEGRLLLNNLNGDIQTTSSLLDVFSDLLFLQIDLRRIVEALIAIAES